MRMNFILGTVALAITFSGTAAATTRSERILQRFGARLADATCTESPDLTTTNPNTTPANNSIQGLPPFAFTPVTDRGVIAPDALNGDLVLIGISAPGLKDVRATPLDSTVPGVELHVEGREQSRGAGVVGHSM